MSQKTEMESLPANMWIHRLCLWGWLVTGLMDWQLCPLRMLRDALWEVVLLVVLHATCCCLKRVSERKNRIKMTIYDIVITCHCILVYVHNCTYMCIYMYTGNIYILYSIHTKPSDFQLPRFKKQHRYSGAFTDMATHHGTVAKKGKELLSSAVKVWRVHGQ